MKIEKVDISTIQENPDNPRILRDEKFQQLVTSIKNFPEMLEIRPIVVNDENMVLGGNMRLKACTEAGLKKVPVIKAKNLTPEQQREFIIKDNVGFGQWDWDILANEWDTEKLNEWGMETWSSPDDIDLDNFFDEPEDDGSGKKGKIVLEYSEDEYDKVVAAFDKIDGSKEQIVWEFLNLDEEE